MGRKEIISHYLCRISKTDPEQILLMEKLLEHIFNKDVDIVRFSSLHRQFDERFSKEKILKAIQKLIIGKYKLLDIAYEFYDEADNDEPYSVSKKEYKEAKKDGFYIHPKYGIEVPYDEFIENTVFYFIPLRDKINELINS